MNCVCSVCGDRIKLRKVFLKCGLCGEGVICGVQCAEKYFSSHQNLHDGEGLAHEIMGNRLEYEISGGYDSKKMMLCFQEDGTADIEFEEQDIWSDGDGMKCESKDIRGSGKYKIDGDIIIVEKFNVSFSNYNSKTGYEMIKQQEWEFRVGQDGESIVVTKGPSEVRGKIFR